MPLTFIRGKLSVYTSYLRLAFLSILAYRMRYYTGIVTYTLFVSVHYFIWKAVFSEHPPEHTIHGFTLSQMITYIAVGWICRSMYFSNIDEQISEYVKTGEISSYLIRPVSFHLLMLSHAAGESLFRLLFFTFPIGVCLLLLFPISGPFSAGSFGLFLGATFVRFLVFAEINFLVGLLAFSWKSIDGIMRAKYFLVQLLSGLMVPLPFFPEVVQKFLAYPPFGVIAWFPLKLYLGLVPSSALPALVSQLVFWAILLFVLSELAWKVVFKRLTIQGG